MLCLPEYNKPYLIESLTAPVVIRHHWVFNAQMCDFTLAPIHYLEETTGAAVKVRINNSEFWVPASWNILVTDRETCQLDTINIHNCATVSHTAFGFSPTEMNLITLDIMVLDYTEKLSLVHPMINKATALAHPVGPMQGYGKSSQLAVIIGPHDLYKHIGDKTVGDLFS